MMIDQDAEYMLSRTASSLRLKHWGVMLASSIIVLIGTVQARGEDYRSRWVVVNELTNENWALTCSIFSLLISTAMIATDVFQSYVPNKKWVDGILTFICTVVCSANVSIVSDPSNGIAVDVNGSVFFGNLYYFTWASFLGSVMLAISFISSATMDIQDDSNHGNNVVTELFQSSPRLRSWFCLMVCSIVVMGASSSIYESQCLHPEENNHSQRPRVYCRRTILGISFGCISTALSLVIITLKISMRWLPFLFLIEFGGGILLFVMFGFGVAFITSDMGPGSPLGNLYYFSWLTFGLTFVIASSCYEDYHSSMNALYEDDEIEEEVLENNNNANAVEQTHRDPNNIMNDENAVKSPNFDIPNSSTLPNTVISNTPSSPDNDVLDTSFDDIPMESNYADEK